MNDKIAIIVIGMHRSGSSAMARLLSLAGASLPHNLMVAAPSNETGHWEPQRVADFNDRILNAFDATWDTSFGLGMSAHRRAALSPYLENAQLLIREDYAGRSPIVLKEPRISLLADLWTLACEAEGYRCKFVIMVRNPVEVAASLRRRNGIMFDQGLLLWGAYQASSELLTREHERIFCRYEDILIRPTSVLDDIEDKLRIELPRRTAQSHAEINGFIRLDLKHESAKALPAIPAYLAPIGGLSEYIDSLIDGQTPNEDKSQVIQDWFSNLDHLMTPIIIGVRAERDRAVKQLQEQLTAHVAEVSRLESPQVGLRTEIKRLTANLAGIEAARLDAENRFTAAHSAFGVAHQTIADLTTAHGAQVAELATLHKTLERTVAEASVLSVDKQNLEAAHGALAAELACQRETDAQILAAAVGEREALQSELVQLAARLNNLEKMSAEAENRFIVEDHDRQAAQIREQAREQEMVELRAVLSRSVEDAQTLSARNQDIAAAYDALAAETSQQAERDAQMLAAAVAEYKALQNEHVRLTAELSVPKWRRWL